MPTLVIARFNEYLWQGKTPVDDDVAEFLRRYEACRTTRRELCEG